jgi:hypothetical protein
MARLYRRWRSPRALGHRIYPTVGRRLRLGQNRPVPVGETLAPILDPAPQLLSARGGSGGDRVTLDRCAAGDGRSSPRRRRMKHTPLHLFLFSFCSLSRHSVSPMAALRGPSPGGRWSLNEATPATSHGSGRRRCSLPPKGIFPF